MDLGHSEEHSIAAIVERVSEIVKKTDKLCVMFSVANVGLRDRRRKVRYAIYPTCEKGLQSD